MATNKKDNLKQFGKNEQSQQINGAKESEASLFSNSLVLSHATKARLASAAPQQVHFLCSLQSQSPFLAAFHRGFSLVSTLLYCHCCISSGPLISSKAGVVLRGMREMADMRLAYTVYSRHCQKQRDLWIKNINTAAAQIVNWQICALDKSYHGF